MIKKTIRTISDIAKLAGVSKSTVSRALNDSSLIGDETKKRIQEIARMHNFLINAPARRLSLKESRTIALVTHPYYMKKGFGLADLFMLEIMGGIFAGLGQNHYDLLVASVNPHDLEWPARFLDTGRVDGFILMTSSRKNYHIKALTDINAPFIIWGSPDPGTACCSVTGDNFNGGKLATEYLIRAGRKHIAFLGGPSEEFEVQKRYEGYASAQKTSGMQVEPELVNHGYFSIESGAERVRTLLDKHPEVDAIFANSDFLAMSAIKAIQERGLRVPDDIAVVGYDNLSIAEQTDPPLTTISQDIFLAGRLLAENLIQYLQTGVVTNVTIPTGLVIRHSA